MIKTKPFSISQSKVLEAYQNVKRNGGSAGVDGLSLEEFKADSRKYLYRLWNRMSSGSYIPMPVQLVEIPKKGGGVRPLGIPTTRTKLTRWERSVIWSMLRNPAYCGKACFGKTDRAERQRITRPLRAKGGYVSQSSCNRERPREEWIEIPVPTIITQDTFDMAQERLKTNKLHSKRNTNIETLLQNGMMVCSECGYSLYRTYTTTSARNKIFYYRCFGSDPYRFEGVRKCSCKPLRQDYIDKIVWDELVRLIQDPGLIRSEI